MVMTPPPNQNTEEQHVAAAKLQAEPLHEIGTRILKQFDNETHKGTVADHDANVKHCEMQCDNGDKEEMDNNNNMNKHQKSKKSSNNRVHSHQHITRTRKHSNWRSLWMCLNHQQQ